MNVTEVYKINAPLSARAVNFARCTVVKLIGRPQANVINQDRLIPPNVDLNIKLMTFPNIFVCKLAAQEKFKLVMSSANIIIYIKQFTRTGLKAIMERLKLQNMRHQFSRIQMKHLTILSNQTSINFDNVVTRALSDLVIVSLVSDADLAGGYHRKLFNLKFFGVNRIEIKRNGTSVPRKGYIPKFANDSI